MDIVLVHGYNVSSTRTYGFLPQRLAKAGHNIRDVFLSKYVTLDDDISLPDLVRAFDAALRDVYGSQYGKTKFGCITHSTGGLVARAWVDALYGEQMSTLPMSHLVMLAPPTNGSRLAELGKSRLSRLRSLVGVEPGLRVLDALELGSKTQWDLNASWIRRGIHKAAKFFPFVITGQWIDKKIWDAIVPATYERGSDGVVRASAANLNMQRFTVGADGKAEREEMTGVAFLMTPRTSHSDTEFGIMGSIPESGDHPVLTGLLSALGVKTRRDYGALAAEFEKATDLLQRTEMYHDGTPLSRYSQLVFRVSDDRGWTLSDYAIELIDGLGDGGHLPSGFFSDKHQNEVNPEHFCYYLNHDRLREARGGKFGFKVQCVTDSPLVRYADTIFLAPVDANAILRPNQTTLIDAILHRRLDKAVFDITDDLSEQKITGKPAGEWID